MKDGVAGLMEFRMAILRDKKRSSLMRAGVKTMQNSIKSEHSAEHDGESADHSTAKSLLKSRSKWKSLIKKQKAASEDKNLHNFIDVGWNRDLEFEEEPFFVEDCFTASGRYARMSIYASYEEQFQADSLSQAILLENEHNKDLLMPLQYFFGQDPAGKMKSMKTMEKFGENDILVGQCVIELPSIDMNDDVQSNSSKAEVQSKSNKMKSKLERYWKRQKAVFPLSIFANASEAAYESEIDIMHRSKNHPNVNMDDGSFPQYGYAGEVEIEYGWSPIRKRKSRDVKTSLMVNLAGIGISLIDKTPQELLYFTLQSISLLRDEYADRRVDFEFKIQDLQVANQLPLCRYNILLGRRYNSSEL